VWQLKDESGEPYVPKRFRVYLAWLIKNKRLRYLGAYDVNSERPTVLAIGTSYYWGYSKHNFEFTWSGEPNAYNGELPDNLQDKLFPEWEFMWNFSHAIEKHYVSELESWSDEEMRFYSVTPERRVELDEVAKLCEAENYSEAKALYLSKENE